jgi:hypothetical protein
MRAMTKLVLSKNGLLTKKAGKVLAQMLKNNSVLQELDVSDNYGSTIISVIDAPGFAKELAVGLCDNGAMTSLNLASNSLGSRGAKIVAEAIKVTKCTPAISMAPFSCSSVFSINCCCLLLSTGYGGPIDIIVEEE